MRNITRKYNKAVMDVMSLVHDGTLEKERAKYMLDGIELVLHFDWLATRSEKSREELEAYRKQVRFLAESLPVLSVAKMMSISNKKEAE